MTTVEATTREIVRKYTEEGYNAHDPAVIKETVADDIVVHGLHGVDGPVEGVDAYLDWAGDILEALPDVHLEIEELIAEGSTAAVHWTITGTQEGPIGDVPATGEEFSIRALALFHVDNGEIVEKWYNPDELSMLQQLGVME